MRITQDVRAFAIEQAGRRCECTGGNCRHHLPESRCKHGLRGDEWKVFWRSEDGGVDRENIEAWCLECFDKNFDVPRETVSLLSLDLADYPRLLDEDQRKAITLKSVLRDAAEKAAADHKGRTVLDRVDDDILVEFSKARHALNAVRSLHPGFKDLSRRLKLPVADVRGAIHQGEVTRWRSGMIVGDAVEVTASLAGMAKAGQIVVTGPAVPSIRIGLDLEPIRTDPDEPSSVQLPSIDEIWALRL